MSRPRRFAALAVLTALLLTLPGCGRQTVQESAQVLTMDTVMTQMCIRDRSELDRPLHDSTVTSRLWPSARVNASARPGVR